MHTSLTLRRLNAVLCARAEERDHLLAEGAIGAQRRPVTVIVWDLLVRVLLQPKVA